MGITARNEGTEAEMRVRVTYDGPAVRAGRMDARDLAPAMLATAKLFEHSAALMYGSTAELKIEVNADFRRGSFSYDLFARAVEVGHTLLNNLSVSDIITTGILLVGAVKVARGRQPARIERGREEATIVFHEGDSITVNIYAGDLFQNRTIREDLEEAVEPLNDPGIDLFRLEAEGSPPTEVTKGEVDYFRAPEAAEEVLQDRDIEEIIQVLAPHFTPGNKWQFALAGEGVFWANITDEKFLRRVATHEVAFGSGDALRVRMRVKVTRSATGKFDRLREISEVIDVLPPPPEAPTLFTADELPPLPPGTAGGRGKKRRRR